MVKEERVLLQVKWKIFKNCPVNRFVCITLLHVDLTSVNTREVRQYMPVHPKYANRFCLF